MTKYISLKKFFIAWVLLIILFEIFDYMFKKLPDDFSLKLILIFILIWIPLLGISALKIGIKGMMDNTDLNSIIGPANPFNSFLGFFDVRDGKIGWQIKKHSRFLLILRSLIAMAIGITILIFTGFLIYALFLQ